MKPELETWSNIFLPLSTFSQNLFHFVCQVVQSIADLTIERALLLWILRQKGRLREFLLFSSDNQISCHIVFALDKDGSSELEGVPLAQDIHGIFGYL